MGKKIEDLKFEEGQFEPENEIYERPRIVAKDAEYEEVNTGKKAERSLFENVNEHSEKTKNEEEEEIEEVETEEVEEEEEETKSLIDGKMFLYMINIAVPGIVWMIYHVLPKKVQNKYDFDRDKLKMDDEEKGLISEGADEVARILFGNLSPIQQFFLGLATIYAMKIPEAFTEKSKE